MICMINRGVINLTHHVIWDFRKCSWENRRSISLTECLSNLLNQHTPMAQSLHLTLPTVQAERVCLCVCERKKGTREIQQPICTATSPHGHQKQIRSRSEHLRERSYLRKQQEQSHDLSGWRRADSDLHCWEFNLACSLIKRLQIYTPHNPICLWVLIRMWSGRTYCNTNPICSFSAASANCSRTWRERLFCEDPNDKINTFIWTSIHHTRTALIA